MTEASETTKLRIERFLPYLKKAEWEEIQENYIKYCNRRYCSKEALESQLKYNRPQDIFSLGFGWEDTSQGYFYWENFYDLIRKRYDSEKHGN